MLFRSIKGYYEIISNNASDFVQESDIILQEAINAIKNPPKEDEVVAAEDSPVPTPVAAPAASQSRCQQRCKLQEHTTMSLRTRH